MGVADCRYATGRVARVGREFRSSLPSINNVVNSNIIPRRTFHLYLICTRVVVLGFVFVQVLSKSYVNICTTYLILHVCMVVDRFGGTYACMYVLYMCVCIFRYF